MLVSLMALAAAHAAYGPDLGPNSGQNSGQNSGPNSGQSNVTAAASQDFARRQQARIAFTHSVRNFKVTREEHDDVLYLETTNRTWYRGEVHCFGMDDPRDAISMQIVDQSGGVDQFSRVALYNLSGRGTQCRLDSLVQLTPEEAIARKLVRNTARSAPQTQAD